MPKSTAPAKSVKSKAVAPKAKGSDAPADARVRAAKTTDNARGADHQAGLGSRSSQRDFTSGKASGNQ